MRTRTKPINPYLKSIMDKKQWKNLKEAAEGLELSPDTVHKYAEGKDGIGPELRTMIRTAQKLGIPPIEFINGILEISA